MGSLYNYVFGLLSSSRVLGFKCKGKYRDVDFTKTKCPCKVMDKCMLKIKNDGWCKSCYFYLTRELLKVNYIIGKGPHCQV